MLAKKWEKGQEGGGDDRMPWETGGGGPLRR